MGVSWGLSAVAGAVFVLTVGSASPAPAAPAQAPPASIAVAPSPVAAGSDVSVTGGCPAGTAFAEVTLFLAIGDHQMWFTEDVTASGDGTFATTVTIPTDAEGGSWEAVVDCDGLGTTLATTTFSVTGGAAPMTFEEESPVVLADGLLVRGTGCTAGGVVLERVQVDVFELADGIGSHLGSAVVAASPDGSWSATVALARSAEAVADGLLVVVCGAPDGMAWTRYGERLIVLAGTAQATITTTTVALAPTTTRAALPRTGSSSTGTSPTAMLGAALVVAGAIVRRATARRAPVAP